MPPLVIAGLVAGGIKATTGLIQASQANKQIKNLAKTPIDEYSISPELQNSYGRAEAMANQGFAPEEKAAFQQGVGRQQAGAFRSAVDMSGGNLSSAVGAALKAQNIGVQSNFAAQGASLRKDNMRYADEMGSRIQAQKNIMTEAKIQRRQSLEAAYGQAKQQGIENFTGGLIDGLSVTGMGAKTPVGVDTPNIPITPEPDLSGITDPTTIYR